MTLLTNDMLSKFVGTHRFVVIHFWAEWNGVDRLMQQLLESLGPSIVTKSI